MIGIDIKAKKLSWEEVSEAISSQIYKILREPIACIAKPDDMDYWAIRCPKPGISLSQTIKLMEKVQADSEMIYETLLDDRDNTGIIISIGMLLADALLKHQFQADWETELICKDALYLIDVKECTYRR